MTEKNRDFKGVWIPKEIWLNKELNALEKIILTEIDSLDNEEHCNASNEYLAEFCQCSEWKVSNAIKKLKDLNYIEILSFDGRHRFIGSRLWKFQNPPLENPKSTFGNSKAININNNINNIYSNSDEKIESVIKYFEDNIGAITPAAAELLLSYLDDGMSAELIQEAIKIATLSNNRNTRYINGILKNWKNKGYKIISDIQQEKKIKNKIDGREYDGDFLENLYK